VKPHLLAVLLVVPICPSLASCGGGNEEAGIKEAGADAPSEGEGDSTPAGGASTSDGATLDGTTGAGPRGDAAVDGCAPLSTLQDRAVFDGDLSVTSENVEEARQYTVVTGNLAASGDVELPFLMEIGGTIAGSGRVRLPNLRRIGGDLYFYLEMALKTLDLRNLEEVGGRVYLHRNLGLEELQLEKLVSAGGGVEISANLKLPDCFLVRLRERFRRSTDIILMTEAPDCTCTIECGVVEAQCR
jgi:hypothetical protein